MGKIGLVTFYENNYGSILQCFAISYLNLAESSNVPEPITLFAVFPEIL